MTKYQLKKELESGKSLDSVLDLQPGQESEIYKANSFHGSDRIMYIPDTRLNKLNTCDENLSDSEIDTIISYCYTGYDFIDIAMGNRELAIELWEHVDWQNPDLQDVIDMYEEDEFERMYGTELTKRIYGQE